MNYYKLREIKNYKLPVDATIQTQTIFDKLQDSTDIVNFIDATSDKIYSLVKDNAITESKLSEEVRTKLNAPSGVSSIISPNNTLDITNNEGDVSIDINSTQILNTNNIYSKLENSTEISNIIQNDKIISNLNELSINETKLTQELQDKINTSNTNITTDSNLFATKTGNGYNLGLNESQVLNATNLISNTTPSDNISAQFDTGKISYYIIVNSIAEDRLNDELKEKINNPPSVPSYYYQRPTNFKKTSVSTDDAVYLSTAINKGDCNVAFDSAIGNSVNVFGFGLSGYLANNNDNLTSLNCGGNNLDYIDLSNNTLLESLSITSLPIEKIDISNLVNLKGLNINSSLFTEIDLTKNILLQTISASNSKIEVLNLENQNLLSILEYQGAINLKVLKLGSLPVSTILMTQALNLKDIYSKRMDGQQFFTGFPMLPSVVNLHLPTGSTFTVFVPGVTFNIIYDNN